MDSPSRSFDAFDIVYYTEDVTIIDPLTFDPALPFSVDLLRVKGARSPIKSEECTVARVERRSTSEAGLIGKTRYSFVLSQSDLARCTFRLMSSPYANNMVVGIEATDKCVLVNARALQPNRPYPLKHLDYVELLDAESNKRWRFQYSIAQLFYDHLNYVSYDVIRKLGQGGQGSVFECSSRSSLERVAVKVVRKPAVKTKQPQPAVSVDIHREVRMLKKLWEARSIQSYLDAFSFPKRLPQSPAALTPIPIIPFRGSWHALGSDYTVLSMAAGDLHRWCANVLASTKRPPSEAQACSVATQVFDALRYIHREGLVHTDLKPSNILIMDKGFHPRVVVSDFGLCMEVKELEDFARNKGRVPGTPMYLPPETTTSQTRLYPIAGPAIDIWAAGITLYYMFTVAHFLPKGSVTAPPEAYTDQFFRDVWQFLQGKGISQLAINIIQRCLTVDPTQRVTAKDALNLSWFKKFEPIGPNTEAQGLLAFSPAGIVDRPLADPEASHTVVCLGAKRPHSEPISDAGECVGKGKAPAQKRRALADGS